MGEAISQPSRGQQELTWLALDACSTVAEQTPAAVMCIFRRPGIMAVPSILRETAYRKTHFRDDLALRSCFFEANLGGYDQMAVCKIRLPDEAVHPDFGADSDYPARIIDLRLQRNTNEPTDGLQPWWELKDGSAATGRRCWRDYSLYIGEGVAPVLADQAAVRKLHLESPGFDNRFSALGHLAAELQPEDIIRPNEDELSDILHGLRWAVQDYQDIGETLLECAAVAADQKKSSAHEWFMYGAGQLGVAYATTLYA